MKHTFLANNDRANKRLTMVKEFFDRDDSYGKIYTDWSGHYVLNGNDYTITINGNGLITGFCQGTFGFDEHERINDIWINKIDKLITDLITNKEN